MTTTYTIESHIPRQKECGSQFSWRFFHGLLAFAAAALLACPAHARLSEPCNIYFGQARGQDGSVLTSGTIVVSLNGQVCDRKEIGRQLADGVNYSACVPLDDGNDLRYIPNAARVGEQVTIAIVCGREELDVDGSIPPVAIAGSAQRADIQVIPEPAAAAALLLALLLRRARD